MLPTEMDSPEDQGNVQNHNIKLNKKVGKLGILKI